MNSLFRFGCTSVGERHHAGTLKLPVAVRAAANLAVAPTLWGVSKMQFANTYTLLVDIMTAATLLYVSFNDLKHYKIRNDLIILLFVLYIIHAILLNSW